MDKGHEYADKELKRLEWKFKKVYKQAEKEVTQTLRDHVNKFEAKDVLMKNKLAKGEITKEGYKRWRTSQIAVGKQWEQVRNQIANNYTNAYKEAYRAINDSLLDVYAENINYSMFAMEAFTGTNISYQLLNESLVRKLVKDNPNLLPLKKVDGKSFTTKVERWNRQKVTSAVTQGIIQGEGARGIAKRLRVVTDMNMKSSILNARTAVTSAENIGKLDAYQKAEELGIKTEKQWIATHDGRTRHTHRQIDGQIVPLKETFGNGCMHPGDPLADPAETYNCRCTMVPVVDGDGVGTPETANGMTYEEWKNEKSKAEPQQSYYKELTKKEFSGYSDSELKAINSRFKELDGKYHAEVNGAMNTLHRDQQDYDLRYKNYTEHLLENNPKMRRSTAEKRTKELLGERPVKADIFKGGDFNMLTKVMTLNDNAVKSAQTLADDIIHREKTLARKARRRERGLYTSPYNYGNVGDSAESVFIHEYGHAIDFTYGITESKEFQKILAKYTKDDVALGISEYAATDKLEMFAEAFAESFMGKTQGAMSKEIMKMLDDIMKKGKKR